jgi:hypothetical protein
MRLTVKVAYSTEEVIRWILFVLIFLLATSFNVFNLSGRNLLLVGAAPVFLLLLLGLRFRHISGLNKPALFLLAGYMILSYFFNVQEARTSSFLYSVFFISIFWILSAFAEKHMRLEDLQRLIFLILVAYLIMTILGHLYVVAGLFNPIGEIDTGVIHGWFGTLMENGVYRYYALATEPSYAAIIVVLLFSQYLDLWKSADRDRKLLWIYAIVLYMLYMFNSGYGFILFGVFVITKVKWKRTIFIVLGISLMILTILLITQYRSRVSAVDRVMNIIERVDYSDPTTIRKIDYSASFRILPVFYYYESVNLLDPHFYMGYGAGKSDTFLSYKLFPHLKEDIKFMGGFLPAYLIDYGLMGFILFSLFFHAYVRSYLSFDFILILLMLTNANFNTQLFWFVIVMVHLKRLVKRKEYFITPGAGLRAQQEIQFG